MKGSDLKSRVPTELLNSIQTSSATPVYPRSRKWEFSSAFHRSWMAWPDLAPLTSYEIAEGCLAATANWLRAPRR